MYSLAVYIRPEDYREGQVVLFPSLPLAQRGLDQYKFVIRPTKPFFVRSPDGVIEFDLDLILPLRSCLEFREHYHS